MGDQKSFREFKQYDHTFFEKEILAFWEEKNIFQKSITEKDPNKPFVFFEGPPSANGMPGIHHVMGRTIKDIFCRYKTLKGYQVKRKAGWDTHGLPIELNVEKELGITKEDIGKKISVEDYNAACRKAVMKYTDVWNDITKRIGYWVDMDHPYITYENKYMESVWWLLKNLYNQKLLYKGYTIQPYSPKAGTGLSSHELNQPGTYQDVKDTTVVAQFLAKPNDILPDNTYFLAWTTTPWTLPSNTALTVGPKIPYVLVKTYNQYTHLPVNLILAKPLVAKQFTGKYEAVEKEEELQYSEGDKKILYWVGQEFLGQDLVGISYEQLLPYTLPYENSDQAFRVIPGDFVTTEDGTGIVHTAPTFGADDAKVAKDAGVPPMLVLDENGHPVPLVDLQGRFRPEMKELAGKYVKNEYYADGEAPEKSVDVEIAIQLKEDNKAFKVEKYEHNYPHCWRTDKPILYYPLDSWFIKVTERKERMVELNNTINWKPKATGTGRFGNWLSNANDWNLSRSRYWGIPIPIWRTEDGKEELCIGSVEELKNACDAAVAAGFMKQNPLAEFVSGDMSEANYQSFDLHKNYVDEIVLVSPNGQPMKRESDLIDVWFDSGSMPYAQWHYPFENKDKIDGHQDFPADFIAEGVDQTRGWFYTLHAIATMCFDSIAYKNIISNGLVLDKNGNKMSKRLGNGVDPFETIDQYGSDATRWYMISNAQPWDNLKFDVEGIEETRRKLFGTLANTYSFFALYANIDGVAAQTSERIPVNERPEIDQWVISLLNTLVKEVDEYYADYEPTKAARAIQDFISDNLSNWYVRLCRRRFWKGEYSKDKLAAYQTLQECLEKAAILMSPIAPFYSDFLYRNLKMDMEQSVHLADYPSVDHSVIDKDLEYRMDKAQKISSMVLSLRKRESIKVRQPLQKILLPILDDQFEEQIEQVKSLILAEVNVKEIEYLKDTSGIVKKSIKPDFKVLGKKLGPKMKDLAKAVNGFGQKEIETLEQKGSIIVSLGDENYELQLEETEIRSEDIEGWMVASQDGITVALDVNITDDLQFEGNAREIVNRIQKERKDRGFEVTDRIVINFEATDLINATIHSYKDYIATEVLANKINVVPSHDLNGDAFELEINDDKIKLSIQKA
ncbi:MAG: isoleucine--tRNA ligase [Chitinophagales bacterium]